MLVKMKNFFENTTSKYKKPSVKYLYFIYFVLSGFWSAENISKPCKLLWGGYIVLSPVIQLNLTLYYYASKRMLTFEEYVSLVLYISKISVPVFLHLSLKIFAKNVIRFFHIIDEDLDVYFSEMSFINRRTQKTRKTGLSMFSRSFIYIGALKPIPWLCHILGIEGLNFRSLSAYFFPMPGLNRIDSPKVYTIVYFWQAALVFPYSPTR